VLSTHIAAPDDPTVVGAADVVGLFPALLLLLSSPLLLLLLLLTTLGCTQCPTHPAWQP
jgi:hypothetical protein